MTDIITQLYAAMADASADIEGAQKDANNPHFKSKYADLSSVVSAIKPALIKHGLWFRQVMHEREKGVCVETLVCHKAGHELSFGSLFVPATKQDAQGFGSALTYARRYSLMTAFGVCPEDDDGNAAVQATQRPAHVYDVSIDDAQYAELSTLLQQSRLNSGEFLAKLSINSLPELPASRFAAVSKRLREIIHENAQQKEAA